MPTAVPYDRPAVAQTIWAAGGGAEVAYDASRRFPNEKIGYGVAANAGRVGVSVTSEDGLGRAHNGYTTQEEDAISNWLLAESEGTEIRWYCFTII